MHSDRAARNTAETETACLPSGEVAGGGAPPAGDLLRCGELLDGKFEIRSLLGQGGMGQVFEAYDCDLHRRVAIKVAWPQATTSVRKEGLALATLRHPGVIAIHALGRHGALDYVVMERICGVTLEDTIEQRRREQRPLSIEEVLEFLIGIAEALAVVHAAGLAHRDVKPANVMLATGGRIVLTDFGVFRPEGQREERVWPAGSPAYMAPETITGCVALGEEYLVDVYALGITAFELALGHPPFVDESLKTLFEMHLFQAPPDLRAGSAHVPEKLAALVQAMMAKDPKARPQTMSEVVFRLRRMRDDLHLEGARFDVVIAEDNSASAMILQSIVQSVVPDAAVRVARDGAEALEMVCRHAPAVLVVDLHLPRVSGIELCTRLREMRVADRCAIVCTSSQAHPREVDRLCELGFPRFFEKGHALLQSLPRFVMDVHASWQNGHLAAPRAQ
jgi:serine/threonine protein kinase